jgi:hypothetical protein
MSISLGGTYSATTNAAIASFDTEVKLAYQGAAALRDTVRLKTGVRGQQHAFQKMGAGVAYQHTSAELITPADFQHNKVFVTLTNWRIGDYTDLFDEAETTVDERADLAKSAAMALGRAEDQLIIDALDAATGIAGTVDDSIGGATTPLNAAKLRRAKRYLVARQASGGKHTLVVNAAALEGALAETQVTSSDYQNFKALADQSITSAFGFRWKVIEDRAEGGLPTGSSNIRLCFAYDESAIGLACGIEPQTRVDFIPERYSYLSQGVMKAGATVIDAKGVVEVQSYES